MTPDEYQALADRTKAPQDRALKNIMKTPPHAAHMYVHTQVLHAMIGAMGELGEMCTNIQRALWYNKGPIDVVNFKEELGDLMWYVSLACNALGLSLDDVITKNIEKLQLRYPEKYTDFLAAEENRDRAAERTLLEDEPQSEPGEADPLGYTPRNFCSTLDVVEKMADQQGSSLTGWPVPAEEALRKYINDIVPLYVFDGYVRIGECGVFRSITFDPGNSMADYNQEKLTELINSKLAIQLDDCPAIVLPTPSKVHMAMIVVNGISPGARPGTTSLSFTLMRPLVEISVEEIMPNKHFLRDTPKEVFQKHVCPWCSTPIVKAACKVGLEGEQTCQECKGTWKTTIVSYDPPKVLVHGVAEPPIKQSGCIVCRKNMIKGMLVCEDHAIPTSNGYRMPNRVELSTMIAAYNRGKNAKAEDVQDER